MGEIMIQIPDGLPLDDIKRKIDMLIREEEAKKAQNEKSIKNTDLCEGEPQKIDGSEEKTWKQDRKRVLDKYCGIIKLVRPVNLEEIMDLEEDAWQY